MKKLIDELVEKFNSKEVQYSNERFAYGFRAALQIVRAHNPWHEVGELPPRDEKAGDCSINVWVTDGERRNIGFYDFAENVWILGKAYSKVTHWAYLPEVKP